MANEKQDKEPVLTRADRVKLTAEESLKRMQAFGERKCRFVAAVRRGKK